MVARAIDGQHPAMVTKILLVGFGEAASSFAAAARWGDRAAAIDIDRGRHAAMRQCGVTIGTDTATALADATIILSLVTAEQALAAATLCAPELRDGVIWCDMNSVAPATKQAAARVIEASGGRYVDAAILAPVNPARLDVPLLLAGSAAVQARDVLMEIGFANVRVVGDAVGRAAAIKLIRSVMVKGIEALTDEMMAAARAAGVVEEVLASLDASESVDPWTVRAPYNLERMATHGTRRAAEMVEAAATLRALAVEPAMTMATIRRQQDAGRRRDVTGNQKAVAA